MSTITNDPNNLLGFVGRATVSSTSGTSRGGSGSGGDWFAAMARALGQNLDTQAAKITDLSQVVGSGGDKPSDMVAVTTAALEMQFKSNSAAGAIDAVGKGLETTARKG
jgi:hypothetical protein